MTAPERWDGFIENGEVGMIVGRATNGNEWLVELNTPYDSGQPRRLSYDTHHLIDIFYPESALEVLGEGYWA